MKKITRKIFCKPKSLMRIGLRRRRGEESVKNTVNGVVRAGWTGEAGVRMVRER